MKRILIPIDLSDSSENAVKIAQKLSSEHTEIVILNIISSPAGAILNSDGTVKDDDDLDYSKYKNEVEETNQLINERFNYISKKTVNVKIGDINGIIMSEIKTGNYDMLVLGITGQLAANFWTNTHTEYLSKHAKIPVLTLKCDRTNMSLDKILFVSDFLESEKINISIIKKISQKFNSKIVLLKILTEDQQRTDVEILSKTKQFAANNQLENFEIVLYHSNNVEEGIALFTQENNIDLIAMGTHQRGGFSTLFRKSVSQDIVRTLYHPIITIPIDNV